MGKRLFIILFCGIAVVTWAQPLNQQLLTERLKLLAKAQALPYTTHYIDFLKKGNAYFEWDSTNTEMRNFWEICEKQTELKIVEEMRESGHYSIFVEFPKIKQAYNFTLKKALSMDYQIYVTRWDWIRFGNSLPVYLHMETTIIRKADNWDIKLELLPHLTEKIDSLIFERMKVVHHLVAEQLNNGKFVSLNILADKEVTNVPLIVTVQNELLRWIYFDDMCLARQDTIGIKPAYPETGYNPFLFQLNEGQTSKFQLYFSQPFGNFLTCELICNRRNCKHYGTTSEGATFCLFCVEFEPNSAKVAQHTVRCGVYN